MGDVVNLQGVSSGNLTENHEFIVDMARFAEALTDEAAIRKKYRLADAAWEALGADDELVRAITDEKTRRIGTGASKREKAQLLVVKAPDVASSIMNRADANDRHRLDACKVLNDMAANPADHTPTTSDKFIITINLGADHVEHYEKSITIDANNGENDGIEAAPVHTGYRRVDHETHETAPDKRPIKTAEHKPDRAKSPQEIALEAMMGRGWE